MGEGTMTMVPLSPEEGKRQRDAMVAKLNAREMVAYVVVGEEWQSALANAPLGGTGVCYAWTGAWRNRRPGGGVPPAITVAASHQSDAARLRYETDPMPPRAGRAWYQRTPPVPDEPPAVLSFVDGVAEVTLTPNPTGGRSKTEVVDGETLILIVAPGTESTVRISPLTDRATLIANWANL